VRLGEKVSEEQKKRKVCKTLSQLEKVRGGLSSAKRFAQGIHYLTTNERGSKKGQRRS